MKKLFILFMFSPIFGWCQTINIPDSLNVTTNAPMRVGPTNDSELIDRLPAGTRVRFLEEFGDYFKIELGHTQGFVSIFFLSSDNREVYNYRKEFQNRKKEEEENEKRRIQYVNDSLMRIQDQKELDQIIEYKQKRKEGLITKYGKAIGEKIFNGSVWIGMTEAMLFESKGPASDVNRTVTGNMVRTQYVYENGFYVYVENGKVVAWQD